MYEGMSDQDKYWVCMQYPDGNRYNMGISCSKCPYKGEDAANEQHACDGAREE